MFDTRLAYKSPETYSHEDKLFYALCVTENKTPEQWEEMYKLGLSFVSINVQSEVEIEEISDVDSFIYDHESPWEDPDNQIPEVLKYYHEYHTQKQHS
jgi:hypothetical protein